MAKIEKLEKLEKTQLTYDTLFGQLLDTDTNASGTPIPFGSMLKRLYVTWHKDCKVNDLTISFGEWVSNLTTAYDTLVQALLDAPTNFHVNAACAVAQNNPLYKGAEFPDATRGIMFDNAGGTSVEKSWKASRKISSAAALLHVTPEETPIAKVA